MEKLFFLEKLQVLGLHSLTGIFLRFLVISYDDFRTIYLKEHLLVAASED